MSSSFYHIQPSRNLTMNPKLTANTFVSSGKTWNLPDSFWEFELRMDGNGLLWRGYAGEEKRPRLPLGVHVGLLTCSIAPTLFIRYPGQPLVNVVIVVRFVVRCYRFVSRDLV